jgi:hypothetical protein
MLLIAQESEDAELQVREMMRLINVCCDNVDTDILPTIDLEYLFLQLRIKSVGETSTVTILCDNCEAQNTVEINLENIETTEAKIKPVITLTDAVSIELQYPSYNMMQGLDLTKENPDTEDVFKLMSSCIVSVIEEDEIHSRDDFTKKELQSFVDSMSLKMFENVQSFFEGAPSLKLDASYECESCNTRHSKNLEGIGDFFE